MNKKMKACFTPHVLMHSALGLGLGILVATLVPGLRMVWLGVFLMLGAFVADLMRKE